MKLTIATKIAERAEKNSRSQIDGVVIVLPIFYFEIMCMKYTR